MTAVPHQTPGFPDLEEFLFMNFSVYYNNISYEEYEVMCAPFYNYINLLHVYYMPVLIAVGLLGNLTSFVVFMTTHLKMRSSSYYLAALAVVEFLFVCVLLVVHCSFTNVVEIYNREYWCQVFVYVSSVCSTLSAWLIVAFTVERFIAVQYPLQRPHMCTVEKAKSIVLVLVVVAMCSQSYIFWTAGMITTPEDEEVCEMKQDYQEIMKVINFVDTTVTLIGPMILILAMNTMIARSIFLFRRRIQTGQNNEAFERGALQLSTSQTISSQRRPGSQQSQSSKSSRKANSSQSEPFLCIHIHSSAKTVVNTRNQQNITKMLLLISTVFIMLNFPSYLIRLALFFVYYLWKMKPPEILWCMQQFAMLLFYTNYSINFLLYAMCGATFRRCLWQLIKGKLALCIRRSRFRN